MEKELRWQKRTKVVRNMFTYKISYLLRNLRALQEAGKATLTEKELKEETKKAIVSYTPDKKN